MTVDIEAQAVQIAAALDAPHQIDPIFLGDETPDLTEAYAIANRVRALRGRQCVGYKVGFTNRSIWPVYGVDRPIWGEVHTQSLMQTDRPIDLASYVEPRLEPEIVLGLKGAPTMGMARADMMACIEWVAPGFEVVQSIYPGWKFSVADSIAAQGLHGCLVLGEKSAATDALLRGLSDVRLILSRGPETIENGVGANALGGPLDVLNHLTTLFGADRTFEPGDLVTTGTLTDAWPVSAGETWSARFGGVIGKELSIQFT